MKKIKHKLFKLGIAIILPSILIAQDLNLVSAGQKITAELERFFPLAAAAIFIGVGLKNLSHFTDSQGDSKQGIKNILVFVFALLVVVGVYRFVKAQVLS